MKLNTRLSVAAVMAAALVVPTASIGAESALAGPASTHAAAATAKAPSGLIAHVDGTTSNHRHVHGTFAPKSFSVANGQLMVTGVLQGMMTGHGKPRHFSSTETFPVKAIDGTVLPAASSAAAAATAARAGTGAATTVNAASTCQILNLNLGPLDLNLLGLQVHLNQVVLNIVAQSGAGQLLGNLLCDVAGLLDNGSPLSGLLSELSGLLNQILGALGGLTSA